MNNNIKKPTKEQIELWAKNLLDDKEMREVTAGLLFFKDNLTQQILQDSILNTEGTREVHKSNVTWIKQNLHEIFQSCKKSFLEMNLTLKTASGEHHPLYLGTSGESKDDNPIQDIEYTISAKSSSDLRLLIRVPEGRYLITTLFANSEEEMGFLYPNKNNVESMEDLVDIGEKTISIINKDDYSLEEDEINFIVTKCSAEENHLRYFSSCIQEVEEIAVIRWLRYIKQNNQGDFNIVNLRFHRKD